MLRRSKLGVWQRALNTVEKSAEGTVGAMKALSHYKSIQRPERFPARGWKEWSSRWPGNGGRASGESMGRMFCGWDEADVGAVREDAPVGVRRLALPHGDSICRTAGYVTRWYGGVGGGAVRLLPIPNRRLLMRATMEKGRLSRPFHGLIPGGIRY